MLAKIAVVIILLIPLIEYYCFKAIKLVIENVSRKNRLIILVSYALISLGIIWALFSFRMWATTSWPSHFIRIVTGSLISLFFGKFVIFSIMLAGDVLLIIRMIPEWIYNLPGHLRRGEPPGIKRMTRSRFIATAALAAGGVLVAGLEYGMTNKYRYRVRRIQIPVNNLPEELNGLRILQLSDIHTGSFDNIEAVDHGVDMALNEKPDLILFTGDLVNYRSDEAGPYRQVFRRLKAPLGVYSVLGNHDYSDYLTWPDEQSKREDFEKLKQYEESMGWTLLKNQHVILNWKGQDFALIGSENWSTHARFKKYGDLKMATAGLERYNVPLKILMSHDPSHWDAQIRPLYSDINLTLSGHTHGMQMGIEIPGFKWSPVKYLYKQWAGLYHEGDQYLYVNRGFGFIGYDGRLGILPEITVIELVKKMG
jgi:uncharacterized protein